MKFSKPLIPGKLIKRYKRFLADIELEDRSIVTAHCPNTGSMLGCSTPGWSVYISSQEDNPKRKLKFTLEMIHNHQCWIGVNTRVPNKIVLEALQEKKIIELCTYTTFQTEVRYGEHSRLDLLATKGDEMCFIEVKNVTLLDNSCYCFPDAVTKRGKKHLSELMDVVSSGKRGVMIFVIQRSDGISFRPSSSIDPEYASALKKAYDHGVEILPYQAFVSPQEIILEHRIEFILE